MILYLWKLIRDKFRNALILNCESKVRTPSPDPSAYNGEVATLTPIKLICMKRKPWLRLYLLAAVTTQLVQLSVTSQLCSRSAVVLATHQALWTVRIGQ